jgi:NADPH:quinone reductase-like Zn-dependent oxidoreductase
MNQFEIQKRELSMRAVVITVYGGEDVVEVRDVPKPQIHDDEVLVEVHSACINPIDVKVKKGKMKPLLTYKFPLILGTDVSGKVVEIGSAYNSCHYSRTPSVSS